MKKKQFIYKVTITHKTNGTIETLECALKPHLGLGNSTDLFIQLKKQNPECVVSYPVLIKVEEYI